MVRPSHWVGYKKAQRFYIGYGSLVGRIRKHLLAAVLHGGKMYDIRYDKRKYLGEFIVCGHMNDGDVT